MKLALCSAWKCGEKAGYYSVQSLMEHPLCAEPLHCALGPGNGTLSKADMAPPNRPTTPVPFGQVAFLLIRAIVGQICLLQIGVLLSTEAGADLGRREARM